MDPRFTPPVARSRAGCDSCKHSTFKDTGVECLHPQRPPENRMVVKWFHGCPQHKENS